MRRCLLAGAPILALAFLLRLTLCRTSTRNQSLLLLPPSPLLRKNAALLHIVRKFCCYRCCRAVGAEAARSRVKVRSQYMRVNEGKGRRRGVQQAL